MTETILFKTKEEIEKVFPSGELELWEQAKYPRLAYLDETHIVKGEIYEVYVDIAYGHLLLYRDSHQVAVGIAHSVISTDKDGNKLPFIVIDKDYYDVHKYIWV